MAPMDPHEKSHESLNGAVGGNQTFVLALFPLIFVLLLVVLSILRFSVFALRCFNRHEWIINLEKLWSSLPNRVTGTECLKNLNIGFWAHISFISLPAWAYKKLQSRNWKLAAHESNQRVGKNLDWPRKIGLSDPHSLFFTGNLQSKSTN